MTNDKTDKLYTRFPTEASLHAAIDRLSQAAFVQFATEVDKTIRTPGDAAGMRVWRDEWAPSPEFDGVAISKSTFVIRLLRKDIVRKAVAMWDFALLIETENGNQWKKVRDVPKEQWGNALMITFGDHQIE